MQSNRVYTNKKYIKWFLLPIVFVCHLLSCLFMVSMFLRTKTIALFLCLIVSLGGVLQVAAEESTESTENSSAATDGFKVENKILDTVLNALTGLTCESKGVGNLIRTEFSHTCTPSSLLNDTIASIISPGLYPDALLRLYINDDDLFPGSCKRGNRIDYNDQKISFSFCNNAKLAKVRGESIAKSVVVIAKAVLTGGDPWDGIVEAWNEPKINYHDIFEDKIEGDSGTMIDAGLLMGIVIPVLPWKIIKDKDKMCVATQSFSGWIPIGCKYIKEPFPVSIYADFLDVTPEGMGELAALTSLTTCGNMGSCYKRAYENSRSPVVMTGPLIECVREMIAKLMISSAVCSFDDVKNILGSTSRVTSALYQFQVNMHKAVAAMLTLYVIFFGFKMVLSGKAPEKSELVNFVVKFLFVTYFSIGININPGSGSDLDRMDGMIQWVFPFMLDGMTQLASWMINASPSKLCNFSDVYYPDELRHLQLWDSLDCKISHYLGLDAMQTMIIENATRHHDFSRLDVLSFPIPPYVYLLVPAIISGEMTLISLAIMYPLLIISVGAFIVNATVVCMISIVILGVLAPLFVPMYLFNYTRGYFDSWVKLIISFMLQPMVAVTFMTTMLAVFDFGFYGTCKYAQKDFGYSGVGFLVGESDLANAVNPISDGRSIRYFYVDQDWENNYTEKEADGCRDSLGYMLNNPLQFMFAMGEDAINDTKPLPWEDATAEESKKRYGFLSAIEPSAGRFFDMFEVVFEKIKKLSIALLTACLLLYLMYNLSESLAEFAADMTEGVSLSNVAIKPQALYKAGMAASKKANSMSQGSGGGRGQISKLKDKVSSGGGGAGDKVSTGGGGAGDKVSTGGGGAGDKISTGGGGAGDAISMGSGGKGDKNKEGGSGEDIGGAISGIVEAVAKGDDAERAAGITPGSVAPGSSSSSVDSKNSGKGGFKRGAIKPTASKTGNRKQSSTKKTSKSQTKNNNNSSDDGLGSKNDK